MPSAGDWEGTVDGFPASFELFYHPDIPPAHLATPARGTVPAHVSAAARGTKSAHTPVPYQFNDIVALLPGGCPPTPNRYSESLITSRHSTPLRTDGALGISRLGFDGSLTGRRSATLSTRYRARSVTGACSAKLTWRMHPAHRRAVRDGLWRLRYADGEISTFRVRAGGRIANGIAIPSELTRCNGVTGRVDLFIAPTGSAGVTQPDVHLSVRFSRRDVSGVLNGGAPGCAGGPFRLHASLEHSGA